MYLLMPTTWQWYKLALKVGYSQVSCIEQDTARRGRGIHLVSLQENFVIPIAEGQLFFHVFTALAEFVSNVIRGGVQFGLRASR